MIVADHIFKSYNKGASLALNDISLEVKEGELFGLIGPDGAGKTSLFQILTTLRVPDKGKATVDGKDTVADYKAIRNIIGYMPGRFSLYQDLTVEENLSFFASIFKTTLAASQHLISEIYVQIEPFKSRLAGQLSGGMKQKLALCCALIHSPKILFLDEPTTGVDAVSRREFWEMLRGLHQHGITILVSTAYMDEAVLCERISLMQAGKSLSTDSPHGIVDAFNQPLYALKSQNMRQLLPDVKKYDHVKNSYPSGEFMHLILESDAYEGDFRSYLEKAGHSIEIKKIKATVEDCFIDLTSP